MEGRTEEWMDGTDENYIPLRHTSYAGGIITFNIWIMVQSFFARHLYNACHSSPLFYLPDQICIVGVQYKQLN